MTGGTGGGGVSVWGSILQNVGGLDLGFIEASFASKHSFFRTSQALRDLRTFAFQESRRETTKSALSEHHPGENTMHQRTEKRIASSRRGLAPLQYIFLFLLNADECLSEFCDFLVSNYYQFHKEIVKHFICSCRILQTSSLKLSAKFAPKNNSGPYHTPHPTLLGLERK